MGRLRLLVIVPGAFALSFFGLATTMSDPGAVLAPSTLRATDHCAPAIAHVSTFHAGADPDLTIYGSCFGTGGAFRAGDSVYFRVSDLGPKGTLSDLAAASMVAHPWWNACSSRKDAVDVGQPDGVTCTVSSWSNTEITLASFTGYYGYKGDYVVNEGDKVAIQVWNVQTSAGPAMVLTRVGAPTTKPCAPAITHVSTFHAGADPDLTINGNCFGTRGTFRAGDSVYFRVSDLGPTGTLSELTAATMAPHPWWNACSSRKDAVDTGQSDGVTCTVSSWSNTVLNLASLNGYYGHKGDYVVKNGDRVVIQVWNVQTLAGPAMFLTRVGSTTKS
jgi:uncharacterized protein YodC (DUF2158 family)